MTIKKILKENAVDFNGRLVMKPCKTLVIPNDAVTEAVFSLSDEERELILDGEPLEVFEARKTKKHDELKTYVTFLSAPKLTQFHRAVMSVITSHILAGNSFITYDIIYRTLCGKTNSKSSRAYATGNLLTAIKEAVELLASTRIIVDLTQLSQHGRYNAIKKLTKTKVAGCLAPVQLFTNYNRDLDVPQTIIFIKTTPLLYEIARFKGQVISGDVKFLDVSNQRNTADVIAVKHYVLHRVLEALTHFKNMSSRAILADIFLKCGLQDKYPMKKARIREAVVAFLENLKAMGVIGEVFTIMKDGEFHSVEFSH